MAANTRELEERLSRYRQINLTVTGRKSRKPITIPVWFVFEEGRLYLLPVHGSDTQWYKNVLKTPTIQIDARGSAATFRVEPITAPAQVKTVVEKFREKYGTGDVKKYYSKFDVAASAKIG